MISRAHIPHAVSAAYFVLVVIVLVWYETSVGVSDNSGLIPGLVLVLLTFPSMSIGGLVSSSLGCARYSTCEHVSVALFAGALNALLIFGALYFFIVILNKKNAP